MPRITKLAGILAATAALASLGASSAQAGYSPVEQCTTLSANVHYSPGLTKTNRAVSETITGTISGCSGLNGPQTGNGSFTATLTSPTANLAANNETGSYVINWPAAAGLNPSIGTLSTSGPLTGIYNAGGHNTAGAYASAALTTQWLVASQQLGTTKKHPVIGETIVNTLPLKLSVNFG